jgi:hypothetical protein
MAGTIESLKNRLDNIQDLTLDKVKDALIAELPDWSEIEPLTERGMPYGRTMLVHTDRYEIMIGCWELGNWCAAHDHGVAEGVCYPYSGEIEHVDYQMNGTNLDLVERCNLTKGNLLELPKGMIHSLRNTSSTEPFIALHIYLPATYDVRVFDTRSGDIYHITDDQGAWVPEDPTKIRKVERASFTYRPHPSAVEA